MNATSNSIKAIAGAAMLAALLGGCHKPADENATPPAPAATPAPADNNATPATPPAAPAPAPSSSGTSGTSGSDNSGTTNNSSSPNTNDSTTPQK